MLKSQHLKSISKPVKSGPPSILSKLMPRHYKVLDLMLEGLPFNKIAETVGMTTVQIRNIRNSPTFKHEYAMRKANRDSHKDEMAARVHIDQTRELLTQNTLKAAQTIVNLLDSENPKVQLQSAQDLLDRTNYPKSQKLESENKTAVVVLNKEDVSRIQETMSLDKD